LQCGSPAAGSPKLAHKSAPRILKKFNRSNILPHRNNFPARPAIYVLFEALARFTRPLIAAAQPKSLATDYIDRLAVIYDNEEFHVCARIK
jgi:hypothetical protein